MNIPIFIVRVLRYFLFVNENDHHQDRRNLITASTLCIDKENIPK